MLERARAQGAASCASSGATRWSCPTRTTRFDAATVGFGARNFSDLERGLSRDGARRAPGRPRRRARDHDADSGRRCRRSSASGSTASCRCSGASPASRDRLHATCRTRSSASRRPRARRRGMERARACARSASPHRGRDHRDPRRHEGVTRWPCTGRRSRERRSRRRRRRTSPALLARVEQHLGESRRGQARRWPSTPARRSPPAASACARCSCSLGRRRPRDGEGARARGGGGRAGAQRDARPRRRARRRRAAPRAPDRVVGGRPRGRRRRPATCCSRARSPSSRATTAPTQLRALSRRELGARRGRAAAARGRLRRTWRSSATCAAAS